MRRTHLLPTLIMTVVILATCFPSLGQAISNEELKEQLVKDWQRAKNYTDAYLNTMPADKYSFRAVDSIRSFAQQMLHLAMANSFFMSGVTGQQPLWQVNLEESATAQSSDSVQYYVNASYDFAINGLKNMPADSLGGRMKLFGLEASKYVFALKAFEHQTHHRGQTTIYIRLLGIRPPQEMLF